MDRTEMSYEDFADLLQTRLFQVREADQDQRALLVERAWDLVQRKVPWSVVLAATRSAALELGIPPAPRNPEPEVDGDVDTAAPVESPGPVSRPDPVRPVVDPRDLAKSPAPPVRHEVGRYERERLSATTRQAIRMGRQARRWHEIRKMRNVLLGIDQGYLKRMLGAESDTLSQEINALLRSWAPLVREQQHGGRPTRRRR